MVGAKELVHWFLGGKGLGIQQGTSVWVSLPKSQVGRSKIKVLIVMKYTKPPFNLVNLVLRGWGA